MHEELGGYEIVTRVRLAGWSQHSSTTFCERFLKPAFVTEANAITHVIYTASYVSPSLNVRKC